VIKQQRGDLVIIPPLAAHQVLNMNGRSIKVAWNRIIPKCLEYSLNEIKLYNDLMKPEVYKIKTMVFYSLKNRINRVNTSKTDFNLLLTAYKQILHDEFSPENIEWKLNTSADIHSIICNKCNGDIFNRFYNCTECEDVDICFSCILKGRECNNHTLQLMECIPWNQLKKLEDDADVFLKDLNEGSSPEFRTISDISLCEVAIQAYQKKRPIKTPRFTDNSPQFVDSIPVEPNPLPYFPTDVNNNINNNINNLNNNKFMVDYYSLMKMPIPQNHANRVAPKRRYPRIPTESVQEIRCVDLKKRRFPRIPTEEISCEDIK